MITSNSINYSKYSIIKETNKNLSTSDLELIEQNKQEKIIEKENEINVINTNENEITNENENGKDNDKLLSLTENEKAISKSGLLYGNKIENLNPRFIGKCLALFYNSEGNPKITIGPDCKIILFNIYIYNIYYNL